MYLCNTKAHKFDYEIHNNTCHNYHRSINVMH